MVATSKKGASSSSKAENKSKIQNSNMKVVVRVRPLNGVEDSSSATKKNSVIRVMDQNVLVFDPNDDCEAINFPGSSKNRRNNILHRRARDLKFIFDRVFHEKSTTMEVFENTTKSIVDGVLEGYNCTVFAYGATGAGKTHTMLGNPSNPGVCFLTMMDLYRRIDELKDEKICDVAVSYLEVYNETIRDLLLPGPPLAVRENPTRGVCVSGLTLHKPRTAEELLGMLEFGNNNRTQHPTDANAQSSRSHAVFQVFVRQKDRTPGLQAEVRLAKMTLIDLAGSERAIVTSNRGERFREGANINKSLLALGNCINALADKENKSGHIPYRNSKLTRLLKDSLGGNCRTVMIAAISPSSLSYEDTYNTLKYADRAKSIKVKLSKNVVSVDWHVSRYAKIVDELRTEIAELKDKIKRYEEGEIVKQTPLRNHKKLEIENLKTTLKNIMNERITIKKDMVDIEAAQRDLLFKAHKKERILERVHLLCINGEEREKAAAKTQKCLSVTKTKKKRIETRLGKTERKLQSNTESLDRVKEEMTSLVTANKELEDDVTNCQSHLKAELECAELRRQCRYFTKYTHAQENDSQNTERLLMKVLSAFKYQFFLLKGAGLATPDIDQEYNTIVDMVTGGREVQWADQSVLENNDQLNMSNMYSINENTTIITTNFNSPSISTLNSILKKSTRTSNSTPVHFDRALTPGRGVAISNNTSPAFLESRVSLINKFNETTPSKPSRANQALPMEKDACNETVDLGSHATFDFRNTTPRRGVNGVTGNTASTKLAWMEPPTRGTPTACKVLSGSGELRLSSYLQASNTPIKKTISADLLTPLRDLSVNKRRQENDKSPRSIFHDTPNKQPKLADKPLKHVGRPTTSMMPQRASESKENFGPPTKSLRKATSSQSLKTVGKSDNIQRHVNGLKRAVSASALSVSRKFDPRSAKAKQDKPRWH